MIESAHASAGADSEVSDGSASRGEAASDGASDTSVRKSVISAAFLGPSGAGCVERTALFQVLWCVVVFVGFVRTLGACVHSTTKIAATMMQARTHPMIIPAIDPRLRPEGGGRGPCAATSESCMEEETSVDKVI